MADFLTYFSSLKDRVEDAVMEAERRVMAEALAEARRISSGPYTRRQLRRMGAPYARRAPRPPLPPFIVNRQSGQFARGWRVIGPEKRLGGIQSAITNDAPHATLLLRGTRRMIPRPWEQHLREYIERERNERRVAEALARALGG